MSGPASQIKQQPEASPSCALRCLVFGGSGALGRAVCRSLHSARTRLAFTYHHHASLANQLADELHGSEALNVDLLSVPAINEAVDQVCQAWEGLDAFIQCAGVGVTALSGADQAHHTMQQVDEVAWDRMQDINTKSTFFAVRRVASHMRHNNGGNVVLIGSIDGVKPLPAPVHYAASKGALAGMTAAMAKELGKDGIRVNLVAPGILEDGMSRVLPEDLRQEYLKHCGLKRYGRMNEIAAWTTWLALRNTYITGQTILVDGGL